MKTLKEIRNGEKLKFFVCLMYALILSFTPGSHPFSELESITLRNYLHQLTASSTVTAAVSVHSFGSVIIYPWGYKVTKISSI